MTLLSLPVSKDGFQKAYAIDHSLSRIYVLIFKSSGKEKSEQNQADYKLKPLGYLPGHLQLLKKRYYRAIKWFSCYCSRSTVYNDSIVALLALSSNCILLFLMIRASLKLAKLMPNMSPLLRKRHKPQALRWHWAHCAHSGCLDGQLWWAKVGGSQLISIIGLGYS